MTDNVNIPVEDLVAAAQELALAARWERAAALLGAAPDHPRLALAAAAVAVEADWHADTSTAAERIAAVDPDRLDPNDRWDLEFLGLRDEYRRRLRTPDEGVRRRAGRLRATAPDEGRRGWAEMYLGLIADNLFDDHGAAPAHYASALQRSAAPGIGTASSGVETLGASAGDDLLRREALRHLGGHDHDNGEHRRALERWQEATAAGARAGNVPGTLSQQMLLAVLARDEGDEAGATALAREVARWAEAIGANRIAAQATGFLGGVDPTKAPEPAAPAG